MPPKKSAPNKTQQLTLRIDDKTRFQLDFCSRVSGMSITTFVERAIHSAAANVTIAEHETQEDGTYEAISNNDWSAYWDPDEGVRTIVMLDHFHQNGYTTYEEDQILNFVKEHWNFFGSNRNLTELSRIHINAIWPHMPDIVEDWAEERANDPKSGFKMLNNILDAASLVPFDRLKNDIP